MTVHWRHWLPDNCADRPDVRAALAAVVADWALVWFATPQLAEPDFGRPTGPETSVAELSLAAEPAEIVRLGALAAEMAESADDLSGADRSLLRGLGEEMIADLRRRFEQRLEVRDLNEGPASAQLELRLGPRGRRPTVRVGFSPTALARLAKSLMPRPPAGGPRVDPVVTGLTATRVELEAILGAAALTLGDLQGLSKGDVLVLDTPLDGRLRLSIKGSDDTLVTARISQETDALTLVVGR